MLTALAVAVALARGGLARAIQRVLPHLLRLQLSSRTQTWLGSAAGWG